MTIDKRTQALNLRKKLPNNFLAWVTETNFSVDLKEKISEKKDRN